MSNDKEVFNRSHIPGKEVIDNGFLESVDYDYPGRKTEIEIIFPEFTSVCPWTGLPDFGTLRIIYVPKDKCVEFKALKYYLNSFRNAGILQEHVVNKVLDDLVNLLSPNEMKVIAEFNARGGIKTVISASHK